MTTGPEHPAAAGAETKVCPMCAESVKLQAVMCRYCGYNFGTGQIQKPVASQEDQPQTSGYAITALVLGLVGVLWWFFAIGVTDAVFDNEVDTWGAVIFYAIVALPVSLLALIFGATAIRRIRNTTPRPRGMGMAVAGFVLGAVFTVLVVLLTAALINQI